MTSAEPGTFLRQVARRRMERLVLTWPLLAVLVVAWFVLSRTVSPILFSTTATPLILLGASLGAFTALLGLVAGVALAARWLHDVLRQWVTWLLLGACGLLMYVSGAVTRASFDSWLDWMHAGYSFLVNLTDTVPAATLVFAALPIVLVAGLTAALWAVQMEPRQFAAGEDAVSDRGVLGREKLEDAVSTLEAGAPWAGLQASESYAARGPGAVRPMAPAVVMNDLTTSEFRKAGDANSIIELSSRDFETPRAHQSSATRAGAGRWLTFATLLVFAIGVAVWLLSQPR